MKRSVLASFSAILLLTMIAGAQTKPPATFSDYGPWETLSLSGSYGGFSPDGKWLGYGITRSSRDYELRYVKLADGATKTIAFGGQPVYSSDSKWLACTVGMSEADQKKLKDDKKPVENKLALVNLAAGEMSTIDGIESFAFSPDGASLAMKRYVPAGSSNAPAPPAGEKPGTVLLVRRLASGLDTAFGNISQYAWQDGDKGRFLAMIVSVDGKTGNGVHLYDPESGVLRVLDSAPAVYSGLAWRKDAADLAVFRARTDDRKEGPAQVVLAWTGIGKGEKRRIYDPTEDASFPAGQRTVDFRPFSWSLSGDVLFLGIAAWDDKIVPAEKKDKDAAPPARPAEVSTVEVWHAKDVYVMPRQERSAEEDRQRNRLAALHLATGKLVTLGLDAVNEDIAPIKKTKSALVAEWSKYAFNRTIGRPAADVYLADVATGARTNIRVGIDDSNLETSPGGKYLLFLQDGHFWTVDTATRAAVNITASVPASFIDTESDETGPAKPPFGVAGWAKDDAAVLLYDKYDVWRIAPDGSGAKRLTNGAEEQVRHRLVRVDLAGGGQWRFGAPPVPAEGLDLKKPVYFSLFGEWTKKSGYARLDPDGKITRLVWLDRAVRGLARAKNADVFGYTIQDYDVSPDIFVGGPDLKDAKKMTATNPFQEKFAWGKSELIEYVSDKGRRLQAALIYPADYEPGKKYPMIVYNYELLSQNVHSYVAPSERSYYNVAVFSSQGYFILEPDIVFRPRQPGWSVVECITAGVKKVLDMGLVDPAKVGIVGHSMGGFNTAFVATHVNGMFAAAVAGAPIIDMVSYYGDHHWNVGIAETDHIETGQERMVVPLYEDLQAYIDNSPYYGTHTMTVPLLLEVGDQDGIVAWHQGIELYNVARRAGKNVVLLAYMGEDHGLRQEMNQKDYQRRILAWFGHFLKGAPAERWITEGQTFLEREAEIKKEKSK